MNGLLRKVDRHVTELLSRSLPAWAVYHDLEHTRETVKSAKVIGEGSGLSRKDLETVLIAAWFHDVGYLQGPDHHEDRSAEAAREYLSNLAFPAELTEAVTGAIRATRLPQEPHTLIEQILCDADIIHVGKKRFFEKSALLRSEMEVLRGRPFTEQEWLSYNLSFVTGHNFHTTYAQREFAARRSKNLLALQERFRSLSLDEEARSAKRKKKEERKSSPERAIEMMFQVVPRNHIDLIALADHKASIMIATTVLIMAIVIGLLASKLQSNPQFAFPTVLLLGVCLAALSFAVRATRPRMTAGTFTRDDIQSNRANILSLGNLHRSTPEDFEWGTKEIMKDRDSLFASMIKDLHNLGDILAAKHRYLRICYGIFMYGMILAVISFAVVFVAFPPLL